ncbi:MAG: hypothetical protein K6G42_01155 [Lachnospiraceae bacterium]|nr:hypothetical protein [Lachnospiraceae bacterium]
MADNIGNKIRKLFDFQRFEKEPGLQDVIEDSLNNVAGVRRLTETELENAAGGVRIGNDMNNVGKAQTGVGTISNKRKCECGGDIRLLSGGRGVCVNCNKTFYDL